MDMPQLRSTEAERGEMMDYTIYGMVCLIFGCIVGFLFGLAVHTPVEPRDSTTGAAYDAMEPTPEPLYMQQARDIANGTSHWHDDEQAIG